MLQVASLLGLARAASESAKRWSQLRLVAQIAVLACGLGALVLGDTLAYFAAVGALVGQGASWLCNRRARDVHRRAEQVRRRAILLDALGQTAEKLDVTDLWMLFDEKVRASAAKFDDADYYASKEGPGPDRLLEILKESAFWSKHLYAASARRAFKGVAAVVVGVLVVSLIVLPSTTGESLLLLARGLVVFLGFIVGADQLGTAIAWSDAKSQLEALHRRLDRVRLDEMEPCLAIFADYTAATSLAPPIPTGVYEAEQGKLNALWEEAGF